MKSFAMFLTSRHFIIESICHALLFGFRN